jgi:SPP1 gp7 family putative phage head morphogenesis protein
VATANENLRDALIRHQVNLQRLGVGLSLEALAILDRTEDSIVQDIRKALAKGATVEGSAGLRRLQFLEDSIRAIRGEALERIASNAHDSMGDLVRNEAEFTAQTLDVTSHVELDLALPAIKTLNAVADGAFEGRTIEQWFDGVAARDTQRIMDGVRIGLTRGEDIDDIVRRVVGTSAQDGADGITNLTRTQVTSLVRTAVNSYSNQARNLVIEENSDVVAGEVYTATLDSRTSPICRSLDGKLYPPGKGKFPPQHFGCRSIRVAVYSLDFVGNRPAKASTEKIILSEYNDLNGTKAATRDDLPRGTKGDFDKYMRQRVREMTGTVPATTTYQDWLGRQSAKFQDEVLGATKAKLFRAGGLTDLTKYVHRDGTELSLSELAKLHASAFRKAGLDPNKYKVADE